MSPDVIKTIERIDERIDKLRKLRDQLVFEFGDREDSPAPRRIRRVKSFLPKDMVHVESPSEIREFTVPNGNGSGSPTRKQQIVEFIKTRGPVTRAEIVEETKIPTGSIATSLNDKDVFFNRDGKWYVKTEE